MKPNSALTISSAFLFGALTWFAFGTSVSSGVPWDWQFTGERERAQVLPEWFVSGQQSLLWTYGPAFTVVAAISGAVVPGLFTSSTASFSLTGRIAFSCPVTVLPLVGWLGMLSVFIFALICAPLLVVVLVQAVRGRTVGGDLASIPFNLLLLFWLFEYGGDWFSVYGD